MEEKKIIVHFDGSCTNTKKDGYMGTGVHAYYEGDKNLCSIFKISKYTGIGTNNESEYLAIEVALTELKKRKLHTKPIEIRGDSKLVISQLNGEYRAKAFNMYKLRNELQALLAEFPNIVLKNIPREQNHLADNLAKESTKGMRNVDYYNYRF